MKSAVLNNRAVIAIGGDPAEQEAFLQDLLTNDVSSGAQDRLVYAALLTPQGKFLADMLISRDAGGAFALDVAEPLADGLIKRLSMYRLRRPITIERADIAVCAFWAADAPPEDAQTDPRHAELGWRRYGASDGVGNDDYDLHRLSLGIPEAPHDLVPNDTFVLEAGFEGLSGVDFQKGCYVGQEIVARMKHKTELKKGYRTVVVDGSTEPGATLLNADGKPAGQLYSNRDGQGIALLRLDRAQGLLKTEDGAASIQLRSAGNK